MNTYVLYLLAQLLSLGLYFVSRKIKNKIPQKIIVFLSILPLFLLVALRSASVGTDTRRYLNLFNRIKSNTYTKLDQAWVGTLFIRVANLLMNALSINPHALLAVFAIITLLILYKSLSENCKSPVMGLYMFFSFCLFYQLFNQFRQVLAICIVLYTYKYYIKKKPIKYVLGIIVATFFHPSSVIMLPFYFIGNIKINKKVFLLYIMATVFCLIGYSILEPLVLSTNYGKIYYGYDMYGMAMSLSSILNFLVRIIILIAYIVIKGKQPNSPREDNFLMAMALMSVLVQALTLRSYVFGRITTYFYAFYILSFPNAIHLLPKNRKKQLVCIMMSLTLLAYQTVYYFSPQGAQSGGYSVYKTLVEDNA